MNGTYYLLCSQDFVHFYELQSNQFSKLQNILSGLQLGLKHISYRMIFVVVVIKFPILLLFWSNVS